MQENSKSKKFIQDFWDIFQQLRISSKHCRTGHTVLQRVKTVLKSRVKWNSLKQFWSLLLEMNEIWRHGYRSENTPNDAFHFSVTITGFEFQPIGFFTWGFFSRFIGKSVQMFILAPLSSKISWFYRQTENIIWFSVIEISTPTNLRTKLTSKIYQKLESADGKNHSKSAQNVHFFIFFLEKLLLLKKH